MNLNVFLNYHERHWASIARRGLFVLFCFFTASASATGYYINYYIKVVGITGTPPSAPTINIGSASDYSDNQYFKVGKRVLIIQMNGASVSTSNTSSYGDISSYGYAGNFEFATIASRSGDYVTFSKPLVNTYDPVNYKVQLVYVSEDDSYPFAVTAIPWDPVLGIGGVVAMENSTSITLGGNIDVSGQGFTGGQPSWLHNGTYNQTDYADNWSTGRGGYKGESIYDISTSANSMRGKSANGGGGGNLSNSGGGGGSNCGTGGKGGFENFTGNDIGGIGGASLSSGIGTCATKVFMGGGGGGGQQGDDYSPSTYPQTPDATPGGDGGGIIIINTPLLTASSTYSIIANGNNALPSGYFDTAPYASFKGDDGAGGGGGAGSVLLYVGSFGHDFNVIAKGGKGGNNTLASSYAYCHAPGGGGGGGLIAYMTSSPYSTSVTYGTAGTTDPSMSCSTSTYGAADGTSGCVISGITLPGFYETEFSICQGDGVDIGSSAVSGYSYSWSPSTGLSCTTCSNPHASPTSTTEYTETITGGCGATKYVKVNVLGRPTVTATATPNNIVGTAPRLVYICPNDPSTFPTFHYTVTGTTAGATYTLQWYSLPYPNTGGASPTSVATHSVMASSSSLTITDDFTPTLPDPFQPTEYYVIVSDGNGCPSTAFDIDVVDFTPIVSISGSHYICTGSGQTITATVTGGSSYTTYQWYKDGVAISGATSSTYYATAPGTYYFTYHDPTRTPSCVATSATTTLYNFPNPTIDDITSSAHVVGEYLDYNPTSQASNYTSLTWYMVDGSGALSTSRPYQALTPGYYYMVTTDVCGQTHFSNIIRIKATCSTGAINLVPAIGTTHITTGTYNSFTVGSGKTVEIDAGSTITMTPCSVIEVEPGGTLVGDPGSVLQSCDVWQGITVSSGAGSVGEVNFDEVTLTDALIGISSDAGGKIICSGSVFKNNKTHIAIANYNLGTQPSTFSGNTFGNVFNLNAPSCPSSPFVPSNANLRMMYLNGIYFSGGTNPISGSNVFNQTICDGSNTVNGIEMFNVNTLGIDGNTFEGYLQTGVDAEPDGSGNSSHHITLTNNTFTTNTTAAPTTGLAFFNVDAGQVGGSGGANSFLDMVNGMTYYYDGSGGTNTNVQRNTFQDNTFGLVAAPHQYPITDGLAGAANSINNPSTYTNTLPLQISCNIFQHNSAGIIGSGNLATQLSGGVDAGNYFVRPINRDIFWDILWQNGTNINYYIGNYAMPNSGLGGHAYSINYVSQSSSNVYFPTTGVSSCYIGPLDGTSTRPVTLTSVDNNPNVGIKVISVFPNPSTSTFTIRLPEQGNATSYTIEVWDGLGRRVLSEAISATEKYNIDATTWCPGMYILRLTDANGNPYKANIVKQ